MVRENTTTIEVSKSTWQRLNSLKQEPGESFDDAVDKALSRGFEYDRHRVHKAYTKLDDLEEDRIEAREGEEMFDYVYGTLQDAEDLNGVLCWQTAIWDGCTIEELIGGLIGAKKVIDRYE